MERRRNKFLCGYMKVQRDVVASVLELSGRHGVFVDRLAKDQVQRPNVSWIERKERSHAAYCNAVCELAKDKSCSAAFRVGEGNNLQNVPPEHVVGVWCVSGVPLEWSEEELQSVLLKAGWLDVEVVAWSRFRKQPWLVRARPHNSLVGVVAAVNVEPHLLTLQRATQRKPKDASSARLNGRVNRGPEVVLRPDTVPEPDAAATQLDGEGDTRVEGS